MSSAFEEARKRHTRFSVRRNFPGVDGMVRWCYLGQGSGSPGLGQESLCDAKLASGWMSRRFKIGPGLGDGRSIVNAPMVGSLRVTWDEDGLVA